MTKKILCDVCHKEIDEGSADHWKLEIFELGRAGHTGIERDYHKYCAERIIEAVRKVEEQ